MSRIAAALLLIPALLLSSCTPKAVQLVWPLDGEDARMAMESTVQVKVDIDIDVHSVVCLKDTPCIDQVIGHQREGLTGSGFVVDKYLNEGRVESLVMTANHVAELKVGDMISQRTLDEETQLYAMISNVEMVVNTFDGVDIPAYPLVTGASDTRDVAVLLVAGDAGVVASLADGPPPVGAEVLSVGAPHGWHPRGQFMAVDGRWLGPVDGSVTGSPEPMGFYNAVSTPSAPGFSGSAVWYKGRVVGILVRGSGEYEELTLLTSIGWMHRALDMARQVL